MAPVGAEEVAPGTRQTPNGRGLEPAAVSDDARLQNQRVIVTFLSV